MSFENGPRKSPVQSKPGWGETLADRFAAGIPAALPFLPVVAAILALKALLGRQLGDEAFIAISHARTWIESGKPVASLLNPVCSTDSPLWLMALAAWAKLSHASNLERIAYQWAALGDLLALGGVYAFARSLGAMRVLAWFAVAAMGGSAAFLSASASASNASWFTALFLWAWVAHLRRPPWLWRALPLLLLPLLRWDGAWLPLLFVGHALLRREGARLALILFAAAALGQAAFFGFYLWAYGRLWPHALIAAFALIPPFTPKGALADWAVIWTQGPQLGKAWATVLMALGLQGLAAFGAFTAWRRAASASRPVLPGNARTPFGLPWLLLAAVLSAGILTASASLRMESRASLLLPVMALLWALIAAGLQAWMSSSDSPEQEGVSSWRAWLGFLPMTLAALAMTGALWRDLPGEFKRHYEQHQGRYAKASSWIDDMIRRVEMHRREGGGAVATPLLTPSFTVLTEESGVYLYRSRARILDRGGRLSPEALPVLRAHSDSLSAWQALREAFHPEAMSALRPMSVDSAEKQRFAGYRSGYVAGAPGAKDLLWLGLRPDLPVQAQP